jgi:hypothetical protein
LEWLLGWDEVDRGILGFGGCLIIGLFFIGVIIWGNLWINYIKGDGWVIGWRWLKERVEIWGKSGDSVVGCWSAWRMVIYFLSYN